MTVPDIESNCYACYYFDFKACYWFLEVLVLIAESILIVEVSLGAVTNDGARLLTFLASSSTLAICCKLVVTDFLSCYWMLFFNGCATRDVRVPPPPDGWRGSWS
jgi:hypothetical protein